VIIRVTPNRIRAVDSVTDYSNKVARFGGKVIKQKIEVPGHGW